MKRLYGNICWGAWEAASHSRSTTESGPRSCTAETLQPWLPGGLIAGGSGMVSTAAIKSSRQTTQMAYLLFKFSPPREAIYQANPSFHNSNILHSAQECSGLLKPCRYSSQMRQPAETRLRTPL